MAATLGLFANGVALGLGAAVPIGPVNVQIARQALRRGFLVAFALGCGAVTIDVFYAVLTAVGVQRLVDNKAIEWSLRLGGFILLTYLGVMCLRGERVAWRTDPVTTALDPATTLNAGAGRAYVTGLLMTLLNPMTVAFWFVAVPALAGPVAENGARPAGVVRRRVRGDDQLGGLFAGLLALAGRFRRNWWLAAADATGGAALLVFAAAALLSSIRSLL